MPKQATAGGKPKLLGITKRGSRYLRKNPDPRCPRRALPRLAATPSTRLGGWLRSLLVSRAHKNTVVVALANKLARIAWAVLAHGRSFTRRQPRRPDARGEIGQGQRNTARLGLGGLREVVTKDGLTVDRRHGQPGTLNAASEAAPDSRGPGRADLHLGI